MAFHEALPEHALAAGADLVISSTHKIVGSLTQSAMLHLGHGAGGPDRRGHGRPGGHADRVDEPQLAAVRLAGRRSAGRRRCTGASCSSTRWPRSPWRARRSGRSRAWTCSTSAWRAVPGVHRLRPAAPGGRRARGGGQRLRARAAAARDRRHQPGAGTARTCWWRCSAWASADWGRRARLVAALREAVEARGARTRGGESASFAAAAARGASWR